MAPLLPTFTICGIYSGAVESAAKWLKKFDLEMANFKEDGKFPPGKYLETLDALLIGEASDWSESHPEAIRLLAEADNAPTEQTVGKFRPPVHVRLQPETVVQAFLDQGTHYRDKSSSMREFSESRPTSKYDARFPHLSGIALLNTSQRGPWRGSRRSPPLTLSSASSYITVESNI